MANRKTVSLVLAVLLAVMLISCSAVFEAGISGKVVTDEGTGKVAVPDVNVFAYTDKGLRDSDFTKFSEGSITRPTEGAGYVATSLTNANGEFVVNKIVWESKKSEFGKTADVNKLYLIFYHEDYVPAKTDATIISGSTNQSNVYVTLEGSKDYTTVNVTVYDVATGRAMTQPCTMEYKVGEGEDWDSVTVTGNATIGLSFAKETTPDVTFKLTSPGANWKMSDSTGKVIAQFVEEDVKEGTLSVRLYMKSYEFTLPGFHGTVQVGGAPLVTNETIPANGNDGIQVWLEYFDHSDGTYKPFTETKEVEYRTESEQVTATTGIYFNHGLFSGVGNNGYSVLINENNVYKNAIDWEAYADGKTASMQLKLVFGAAGEEAFTYTIPSGSTQFNVVIP